MDTSTYVDQAVSFLRDGYNSVNNLPGALLIALAAAILMGGWRQLLPITLLATAVYIAVQTLAPVLTSHAAFHLPQIMDTPFWRNAGILFVGNLIVISVFFFIKSLFVRPKAAKAAH
ncbi:MAG: hypothetical protein ABUL73_04985 [Alphaproteobacteria bacterium]